MSGKTNWTLVISLLALGLQSCSSIQTTPSKRRGLFNDLAQRGSGRTFAETGNPVLDKPRRKEERESKAATVAISAGAVLKQAGLRWPLRAVEVTSTFGRRQGEFHEGIDLRAKVGTSIYAAQKGVVIYAGNKIRGYGKMIVIKHSAGLATVYAHASRLLVRKGQRVKSGQKVAISGATGRATGPHLHFEVRSGVVAVNPVDFLPRNQVAQASADPVHLKAGTSSLHTPLQPKGKLTKKSAAVDTRHRSEVLLADEESGT